MSADAVGGIWAYAEELAAALPCEVVLAGVGPWPPPDESVPYRPGRLEWQDDPWDDVAATRDDYLDTLTAAKLYPPTRRPTDPTDVEPHHLSAELLDALTSATNQT